MLKARYKDYKKKKKETKLNGKDREYLFGKIATIIF